MPSLVERLPLYALSGILLLGAFSRFTHGVYTPQWYAFQEYHAPDDGSTLALATPIVDTIVALLVAIGSRKPKIYAAGFTFVTFATGLAMQVLAGKEYLGDIVLVAVAAAAVWGAR
ncbi:hypothetical protein BJX68DRAFT_249972 [Aspergillus pseudodeflectus]|uniref:Major facilitator superfamily domain-containing protein n=1 Tax=Aspergillus pseudodeflectus TaxID=176178 RepID=A0ABR4JAX2_9EURO